MRTRIAEEPKSRINTTIPRPSSSIVEPACHAGSTLSGSGTASQQTA
jgi:hypothetical protein